MAMKKIISGDHLDKAQKSYTTHLWFALKASGLLFLAAVTSVIHGIFPRLFPFYSAKIVMRLAAIVQKSHSYDHLK